MKRRLLVLLAVLTLVICLHVALVKRPPNYRVVTSAARNILIGENPYARQPGLDFFKYSPLAGLIVAPFLVLPEKVGTLLFSLAQFWLFIWAFSRWARTARADPARSGAYGAVAFLSVIPDATVSIQNCQVNAAVFALMLLGTAHYAEAKPVRSGLLLSLATNLKLFPFTLALCLLTDRRARFWLAFWGGLALWFALPALAVGVESNAALLGQWLDLMRWDQTREMPMLDIGSFLHIHFGVGPAIRNPLALGVGLALGLSSFQLFRKKEKGLLDRFLLPANGLYVLLFSYLSESPTSILATPAIYLIGVEALSQERHRSVYWALWILSLALIPAFYSDLVPRDWGLWARAFHLKTVGYLLVAATNGCLFLRAYRRRKPI